LAKKYTYNFFTIQFSTKERKIRLENALMKGFRKEVCQTSIDLRIILKKD